MPFANLAFARRIPAPESIRDAVRDANETERLRERVAELEDEAAFGFDDDDVVEVLSERQLDVLLRARNLMAKAHVDTSEIEGLLSEIDASWRCRSWP